MSQAIAPNSAQILTFQEYLFYQGEPDVLYELFRGRLIPMANPTALHASICQFLVYAIDARPKPPSRQSDNHKSTQVGLDGWQAQQSQHRIA